MNAYLIKTLALNEVRLRTRRLSTLFALLALVAIAWMMIPDVATGNTLISFSDRRVTYTSATMALGSAAFGAILFGLFGFYLVRGRIAEDIRSGTGAVIGATPVGNAMFLFCRWLGAVATLTALVTCFMLAIMALQLLRGEGPIEPLIYLQTYALMMFPMIFFSAACAVLCDSVPLLMGKLGDVLFVFLWIGQLTLIAAQTPGETGVPAYLYLDMSGMASAGHALLTHMGSHFSLGASQFNPALPTLTMPTLMWTFDLAAARFVVAAVAMLPLLPAMLLFHRYSQDKVKLARSRKRRSPLEVTDQLLRPLSRLTRPLFGMAAALPGLAGQVLADVALTLVASPSSVAALLVVLLLSLLTPAAGLGGVLTGAVAAWGILVCSVATRDYDAGLEDMSGAVRGGIAQRFVRQYGATVVLGLMFCGVAALRWSVASPVRALAVVAGVLSLSAIASMLGRCTRTARTFLALFLFGLYIAVNAVKAPLVDAVGFNGVATTASALTWLMAGAAALVLGYAWNRRG